MEASFPPPSSASSDGNPNGIFFYICLSKGRREDERALREIPFLLIHLYTTVQMLADLKKIQNLPTLLSSSQMRLLLPLYL